MTPPISTNHESQEAQWPFLPNEWLENPPIYYSQISKAAQAALQNAKTSVSLLFNELEEKVSITSLSPVINKIQSVCTDVEKIFNIAGCVPGISILSGTLRTLLGKSQVVTGIAVAAISEIGLLIATFSKSDSKLISKWKTLSQFGIEQTIHGCLNIIRGTGEFLLGSYTFGLGNIALIIPNLSNQRNFTPYFPYGSLTNTFGQKLAKDLLT